ncbi:glycosyltransferase family 2 protein [Geotalea toluenoxydans]|uniref:glycosyltransferase family 2 protein n=1 Tax=Geotalea toluenoxydans TaxID=421624 RepID=UPI0006CF477D|nr:glycosyltransferase family 2 protein [Geotalea toluenoxydans]
MSIQLSICIPTHNRAGFLDEAIASIASQVSDDMVGAVELCISDNASLDNTEQLVDSWRQRLKIPIMYRKNERNLGADANYLRSIEMAEGEFCWFLGSDDRIEPGGIEKVLDSIVKYRDAGIFVFLRHDYNFDFTQRITPLGNPLIDDLKGDFLFPDTREALYMVTHALGYLSILVFKKECWDAIDGYQPFIGSAYVHVFKLLAMMKKGAQVMFVRQEVVGWRAGNDSFGEELKLFGRIRIDVEGFDWIGAAVFGDFSAEHRAIINRVLQVQGKQLVYHLKYSAPTALIQWKVLWLYLRHYWRFCRFWREIFPLLVVPASVLSFAKRIFRSIVPKKGQAL